MDSFEKIKDYSNKVCEQIRWQKAKSNIAKEIEDHLLDQRDAYILDGDNENSATDKSIIQMGDPEYIGRELDLTHRPNPQWGMIFLTMILMSLGIVTNYFISIFNSNYSFKPMPFLIAFLILITFYFIDFSFLGRFPRTIYLVILFTSLISRIFNISVNGIVVWSVGFFSVNIVFLTLLYPLAIALIIYSLKNRGSISIIITGIASMPFAMILLSIPSMSGLLLFALSSISLIILAIKKSWFGPDRKKQYLLLFVCSLVGMLFASHMILNNSYFLTRLNSFINPYIYRNDSGYIYVMIRSILEKSSFIGNGDIPVDYLTTNLSNISTDYTLFYLIHKFGMFVLYSCIILVSTFSIIGVLKTIKQKSFLGLIVSYAVVSTFTLQAVIYILDNLGYGLVSSLSMPFMSYGNTALYINSILVGLMLSVFRSGDEVMDSNIVKIKKRKVISYEDGNIIIDLKSIF